MRWFGSYPTLSFQIGRAYLIEQLNQLHDSPASYDELCNALLRSCAGDDKPLLSRKCGVNAEGRVDEGNALGSKRKATKKKATAKRKRNSRDRKKEAKRQKVSPRKEPADGTMVIPLRMDMDLEMMLENVIESAEPPALPLGCLIPDESLPVENALSPAAESAAQGVQNAQVSQDSKLG